MKRLLIPIAAALALAACGSVETISVGHTHEISGPCQGNLQVFASGYHESFTPGSYPAPFTVTVTAGDDPTRSHGYAFTQSGVLPSCANPTTVPGSTSTTG